MRCCSGGNSMTFLDCYQKEGEPWLILGLGYLVPFTKSTGHPLRNVILRPNCFLTDNTEGQFEYSADSMQKL